MDSQFEKWKGVMDLEIVFKDKVGLNLETNVKLATKEILENSSWSGEIAFGTLLSSTVGDNIQYKSNGGEYYLSGRGIASDQGNYCYSSLTRRVVPSAKLRNSIGFYMSDSDDSAIKIIPGSDVASIIRDEAENGTKESLEELLRVIALNIQENIVPELISMSHRIHNQKFGVTAGMLTRAVEGESIDISIQEGKNRTSGHRVVTDALLLGGSRQGGDSGLNLRGGLLIDKDLVKGIEEGTKIYDIPASARKMLDRPEGSLVSIVFLDLGDLRGLNSRRNSMINYVTHACRRDRSNSYHPGYFYDQYGIINSTNSMYLQDGSSFVVFFDDNQFQGNAKTYITEEGVGLVTMEDLELIEQGIGDIFRSGYNHGRDFSMFFSSRRDYNNAAASILENLRPKAETPQHEGTIEEGD